MRYENRRARSASVAGRLATIAVLVALKTFSALAQDDTVVRDAREDWGLDRVRFELLRLPVLPEIACSKSTVSEGWGDKEPDIAELHNGLFSPYDGVCFPNFHYVDIEHIVARKEADESGMCNRALDEREVFASDILNLTFAPTSLNASKGKLDAGDLESANQSLFRNALTDDGECFLAAQTVRVKSKYSLSVDLNERDALARILEECWSEQRPVGRPQAPSGCGWMIREEFAAAAQHTVYAPPTYCSVEIQTESWRAALQYAHDIACIAGLNFEPEVEPGQGTSEMPETDPAGSANPRASQIAAQESCKARLDTITCVNINEHCPSVTVIHRGEPLYQAKGTNGRSNDSDNDGLYCEGL